MGYQRVAFAAACLAAVAMMMAADASPAFAQRDAGAKMRGEFGTGFWSSNQSGRRRVQHARDYSYGMRDYSRYATPATPRVAREHVVEIGRNIEGAKKDFVDMRKTLSNNKKAISHLDAIDKHLASAMKMHDKLHAECLKESIDSGVTMKCCEDITSELEKAVAEHDKLVDLLTGEKSKTTEATPKKSE